MKKTYSFLQQAFVFAAIMLLANLIAKVLPFPMPASVLGLVLLFLALSFKIVKLEQVESLGNQLTALISFLFVPSGISVINSLGLFQQYGVQLIAIIMIATIILLAITGGFAAGLLKIKERFSHKTPKNTAKFGMAKNILATKKLK